tara:strand:+ start:10127 stop:10744 length:618 start_codon:yes stop_codon:yes gene_type:complete
MKPTSQNLKIMLNKASYEDQSSTLFADSIILPDDIPAFFNAIEEKATGLPIEFADFEYGLRRWAGWGRHAHKEGDEAQTRKYIWKICQNLHALEKNLIDYSRTEGNKKGGKKPKRKEWAENLANHLANLETPFVDIWNTIPEDENNPFELDEDTAVYRTYKQGKQKDVPIVVAVDRIACQELGELTRSSFERNYFRVAKKKPDSN